jgi:hypothetical protein
MSRLSLVILNLAARLPLWSARTVALSTVGLLTIATVGGAALWALTLRQTALEARQELASVREVLAPQPSDEGPRAPAGERFQRACAAAGSAQTALRKVGSQVGVLTPIVGALDLLPGGVGARARAQTTALDAGAQLADLGVTLCHDLQPIGTLLGGSDGAPGSTAESLRALVASRASLVETADRLEKLQGSLGELDREDVPGVSPGELARLREKLPTTAQMLRDSASLLGLFGGDRPRRLLIVSQNPDELRPTGGYIGSAGVVEIKDGVVRLVEYGSSRAYDTPATMRAIPPAPYQPYLGTGYWHMAGANWEPSFPDVARQLEYFFTLSHPGQSPARSARPGRGARVRRDGRRGRRPGRARPPPARRQRDQRPGRGTAQAVHGRPDGGGAPARPRRPGRPTARPGEVGSGRARPAALAGLAEGPRGRPPVRAQALGRPPARLPRGLPDAGRHRGHV